MIAPDISPGVSAAELLDLNVAGVEQLEALPGIGPEQAKTIVRVRQKSGPFQCLDELLSVPRLTRSQLDRLRKHLTVGKEQYCSGRASRGNGSVR